MTVTPLISIISPVYNTERYIHKMIKSVQNQTYKNFELIFIDDVSSDSTVNIIENYMKTDDRIKLIKNEKNIGPGPGKNKAIDISQGKYICFVDGDDWIEPEMLKSFVEKIELTQADVVVAGYNQDFLDDNDNLNYSVMVLPPVLSNKDNTVSCFTELDSAKVFSFCWTKIFRAEIIKKNNIHFPSIMHSEDFFFNMQAAEYIKRTDTVDKAFYHYIKPQHQTLTSSDYIGGYFELVNKRYDSSKNFCLKFNKYDEYTKSLISDTHIKHLFMCLIYNFSKKSKMNYRKRLAFVSEMLENENTAEAIQNCKGNSKTAKILNKVIKTKNKHIILLFSRLMWIARTKFQFVFDRKK